MSPTVVNPRPVPLFELATQYQAIRNEVEAAVREVLESQQYTSGATSGPFVGRFEEHLGLRLGAHVVALSSGTDAILAALMALGIGPGDEVITTPFTFFATAGCISRVGAAPSSSISIRGPSSCSWTKTAASPRASPTRPGPSCPCISSAR